MKPKNDIDTAQFDSALLAAFQGAPESDPFGELDDLSRRRMINDILTAASTAETLAPARGRARRPRGWMVAGGAAAALLLGVAWALAWGTSSAGGLQETPTPVKTYFGEVAAHSGDLYLGDEPASPASPIPVGEPIRAEDGAALLRLPTGIAWQMGDHSNAEISALAPDRIEVSVHSGESWFRVNPDREGPLFIVETRWGRIEVTGTVFSVKAIPSEVEVTLVKGAVWVTQVSGRRQRVAQGHTIRLREGTQHPLDPVEEGRILARIDHRDWVFAEAPTTGQGSEPAFADASPAPGPAAAESPDAVGRRDTQQLLAEIQFARKQRDWQRATALYKRIIRRAPGSETAAVSRVSLGDIYLGKMHRYGDALYQFERYLNSGHTALLPEASFGRCAALGALGRGTQARDCLEGFIRRYPGAFQTADAMARLESLRAKAADSVTPMNR